LQNNFEAIHNKDYSVVKTSKAELRFRLLFCKKSIHAIWFAFVPSGGHAGRHLTVMDTNIGDYCFERWLLRKIFSLGQFQYVK